MGSVTDGTLNGILGTWITEFALDKALSVFSQADFEGTPRSTAKGIVMEFADRDEDGDGTPDAVSLGLKITAEPATLKLSGE